MLHARKDYNRRIQDSENIIPEEEPVFLLRGQDKFAPMILEIYAMLVMNKGQDFDRNFVNNMKLHAANMRVWQKNHKCKLPDMDSEDSAYR